MTRGSGLRDSPWGQGAAAVLPAPLPLEDSLTAIVRWATRHDVQAEVMRRAHCELPLTHIWLLVRISVVGPCHPSELAIYHGVDNSTITPKLQRLEQELLVARQPDPGDRRAVLVEITADGTRLLKRLRSARAAIVDEAMADLPSARRALLKGALGELARLLDRPLS